MTQAASLIAGFHVSAFLYVPVPVQREDFLNQPPMLPCMLCEPVHNLQLLQSKVQDYKGHSGQDPLQWPAAALSLIHI